MELEFVKSVEGARPREALLPMAVRELPEAEGARMRARVPPAAPSNISANK